MKELDYFSKLFPMQCSKGFIVYTGEHEQPLGWKQLLNFMNLNKMMESLVD